MNCQQIESQAIAYLDGQLSAGEREAVQIHLQACSACRDRLQGFTGVFGLLDQWEGIQPSPYFNARLERRIEQEAAARSAPQRWLDSLGRLFPQPVANPFFAVALFAVVAFAVLLTHYSPGSMQSAEIAEPPVVAAISPGLEPGLEIDEVALYRDLSVLEDWDVLRNFELLQELNRTNP